MRVLLYNDLSEKKISGFAKFKKAIETDNFHQAEVKKVGDNLYRGKLNQTARLIFSIYRYEGNVYCLVLEYLAHHEYDKSRFLTRTGVIDDNKLPDVVASEVKAVEAVYVNPKHSHFYYLDKVLSFDQQQQLIYDTPAPVVIIGSAGSGKTSLILEKMKQVVGNVLYVSLSAYLVQNSRNIYYANGYQNPNQEDVDFLSFKEYLESIAVPQGQEVTRKHFEGWFIRQVTKELAAHKVFEEFRGVLTGPSLQHPWLSRQEYLQLGVRQSLFGEDQRVVVYDLFEKYLAFLNAEKLYDSNIISQQYLQKVEQRYDFVVVDEVQDITNTQLMLILKSLYQPGEFMLGGDANQIVHPNFFSWSKVKSLFFDQQDLRSGDQALRILQANYRNSPLVAAVANRVLKLKHARFGSVDKESNYLMQSIGEQDGQLQLLADNDKMRKQLDASTARSTKFAVVVMHAEQKAAAQRIFSTPLVFSIQEAKGLEYDSIILFNFISQEQTIFKEIAHGVKVADLEVDELKFARAKSKADKSLEAYKFYINALYVAVTRAVRNLYIVEADQTHPLMSLLDLSRFTGDLALQKQESSLEEWQQEAHKLELQGKKEQAKDIRERILKEQTVPWPVMDKAALAVTAEEALEQHNKKAQLALLEYSLLHQHQGYLNALEQAGFKTAVKALGNKGHAIKALYKNHFMVYDLKQPGGVLRDINKYGVDHRTRFNLTPLMTGAYIGNVPVVKAISDSGADKTLVADNGLNAWQIILNRLLSDGSDIKHISELYRLLAPEAVSIQIDGRLEKLDEHTMYGFLLNVFFALWYGYLPNRLAYASAAVTAGDLETMLARLPDDVLSPMKKKRDYISRYLSENEVDRQRPRNRKLFKRLKRGHYILNPQLKVRLADQWVGLHDLLKFEGWHYSDFAIPKDVHRNRALYAEGLEIKTQLADNFNYFRDLINGLAEGAD